LKFFVLQLLGRECFGGHKNTLCSESEGEGPKTGDFALARETLMLYRALTVAAQRRNFTCFQLFIC
jgi:hypothetical protein